MQTADRNVNGQAPPGSRFLWLLPVGLAAWRFHPITQNYFYGDDLYNLYEIVNRGLVEYLIKPYGMHLLAARNLVFYLCYQLFGTNAAPYFWVVLLTHLLNVFLLYQILRLFTGSPLACLGAAMWGMSPIEEGALGWFSVYGQVLATTLILWVLYRLAQVAVGVPLSSRLAPWRWAALLLVAAMSFGTGIGVAMAFPVATLILLPASPARRRSFAAIAAVAVALPFLYVGLHRIGQMYHTPSTGQMGNPMTTFLMLPLVSKVTLHLTVYGLMSLLFGPIWFPMPYPTPVAWVVAAVLGLAVIATLVIAGSAQRRQLLTAITLGFACYGIIAVGRVGFFKVFGTKVVTSPRYHYAATAMFAIAIVLMLSVAMRRYVLPSAWRTPLWAAALCLLVLPFALLSHPIDHHDRPRAAAMQAVAMIERRIDAAPPGSAVIIPNRPFSGVGPILFKRQDLFPGFAGIFAVYFPDTVVHGRRIFFVLDDPAALEAARRGRKSARFVLAPGESPAPMSATDATSGRDSS